MMFWVGLINCCRALLSWDVHKPCQFANVSSQDAFNRSLVKADENFAFLSLLKKYSRFWASLTRVEMWDDHDRFSMMLIPRNLKPAPPQLQWCRQRSSHPFFLKSMISSLVFLMLSSRFFSVHHSARLLISSRCEVSSLFEIRPVMVVSSANFTAEFSPCQGLQLWVYSLNRRGLSTQPWGAPLLSTWIEEVWLPIWTIWGHCLFKRPISSYRVWYSSPEC